MSEAKKVLEQAIERWNTTDRDGWAELYTDDVVYEAPGGARISGLVDLKEKYFDALVTAAPDRQSSEVVLFRRAITLWRRRGIPGRTRVPGAARTVLRFRPLERRWTSPSSESSD